MPERLPTSERHVDGQWRLVETLLLTGAVASTAAARWVGSGWERRMSAHSLYDIDGVLNQSWEVRDEGTKAISA